MGRIRVLQLIDQLGTGGAESLQYTLAASIDRKRFAWHVCALRKSDESLKVHQDLLKIGVPVSILDQKNVYDVRALLKLVRYIHRYRIDIIHTHLAGADILGRVAGFLTRRPVVSSIHLLHGDLLDAPARRQLLLKITARWMCRRIVVVADSMRQETAEWLGLPLTRVETIVNGVDTTKFQRENIDPVEVKRSLVGGDYPLVVSIARLTAQKGHSDLVTAAGIVASAVEGVRFAFVGDGPLRADLASRIEAQGLSDTVLLLGTRDDIRHILAASDVFALSSLQEGLPVAVLEAAAAGLPIVATGVGGVPEVIRDGTTGLLVQPGDPQAMADAIIALLTAPRRARELAAAAKELVEREYSTQAWSRKWEALYLQEVRRRRRRRGRARGAPGTLGLPG
ncbi:MAG: glycosyltransferase [Chloroflexota bacterium]|nr:glycosyltransferase [Chloroflexota bacterium]MDQ5867113.1 glycosyltransferase [Chloroflexota bacterium]